MKTVKVLAFALLLSSVSFAQTKANRSNTKAAPVAPVAVPVAPSIAQAPAPQVPSQLTWDKEVHDFGTIEQGKPVTYEFSFVNTTKKDVLLIDVKASCGCTTPNYTKTAIKPGERGVVSATFNAASGGPFNKTVTVRTSEENAAPKIISIKGTVKVNEAPNAAPAASK